MVRHAITIICLLLATQAPAQVPRNVMDWLSVAAASGDGGWVDPNAANLQMYYDGTADAATNLLDKSGNGRDAVWVDAFAATTVEDGYIHYPFFDCPTGHMGGAEGSWCAWVEVETSYNFCLFHITDYSGSELNYIRTYNADYRTWWRQGGGLLAQIFNPLTLNTVTHIAYTWKTDEFRCYADGVLVGEDTSGTWTGITETYNRIGRVDNTQYYFRGNIDEIRMYNKTLSSNDVYNLYINTESLNNIPE